MRKSTAGRLALAAAGCILLAQGAAFAADPLRLTQPVRATKADLDPQRTWSAPYLLVHPKNPDIIVGGVHEFRDKKCSLMRSTDAGATWKILDADPALSSYPFCMSNNSNIFQAPMAWGRDNTLYMGMAAWDTPDTRDKVSVQLAKSTDLGDTWTTTLVRDARPRSGADAETNRPITSVAVDTSGSEDVVYLTWRTRRDAENSNRGPDAPTLAISTDGGTTFGNPIYLSDEVFADAGTRNAALAAATQFDDQKRVPKAEDNKAVNMGGGNPMAVVDKSGAVYVGWKSAYRNITPTPPAGVFVSKSTDRGATWTHTQVRPFDSANGSGFVIPMLTWTDKGGPQGTLHMATEGSDRPNVSSYSNIFYLRSTDGAATWSDPVTLPDAPSTEVRGKYLPFIQSAPNGRIDVVWWDTRDDPGIRANDVYYVYSTDNGMTWSKNIRVTDQTVDRRFGVWGNNFDQNSPPSLASTNAYALMAWDDTRLSRGDDGPVLASDPVLDGIGIGGGVQDVFVSAVQFKELGAGGASSTAKAILAGVVGLVAVGLVLLGVSFAGRSGSGGSGSAAASGKSKASAPAG